MSRAVIEITTEEGDKVELTCRYDPPLAKTAPEHLSHALAGMAMLAIARELKGPKDHAIAIR